MSRALSSCRFPIRHTLKLGVGLSAALLLNTVFAANDPVLHYQGQTYQQQSLPSSVQVGLHELEQEHNQNPDSAQ